MYFVTTKTSAHVDGSLFRVLATTEKRDTARSDAARLGGTVRTQAELDKLIEAGRLDKTTLPGYVAPEPQPQTLVDLAAQIRATNRARRTVGKKEKFTKRVQTPEAVLAQAQAFATEQIAAGLVKVALVRALAAWKNTDGAKLQRRDMFAVLTAAGADVAKATISTQFQIVRSGKL